MPSHTPVTIVVSSFEDIVALGLQTLIDEDPNLELLASGVTPDHLAESLEAHRPRVALLNYGSLTSPTQLRELNRTFADTRLVVLANRPSPSECRQMLAFGATACLAKSTEARDVLHAIHLASRGLTVLPPATLEAGDQIGPDLLTPREADVLELLQSGRSNAEIAQALQVSVETVRTHVRRIYRKLGVEVPARASRLELTHSFSCSRRPEPRPGARRSGRCSWPRPCAGCRTRSTC